MSSGKSSMRTSSCSFGAALRASRCSALCSINNHNFERRPQASQASCMHSSLLPATAALQTYTLPAQQKGQIENMVRALVERSKTGANKRHAPSTDSSEESDDGGEEAAEEQEAEEAEPQSPLPHAAPSRSVRGAGGIGGRQQGDGAADAHGGRPTRTRRPPVRREDF